VLGEPFGSTQARAGLGFLPDLPHFYSYLTGRELLRFTGRLHSIPRSELERRIEATLDRVRLAPDSWDRRLRHYSRGLLQRVGIAAAILHRPRLLVLDEPMTGLDPIGRRELRDLLLDLKKEGVTIFFSSHLLADVESIADRVALLADGRLVRCAPLDEILDSGLGTVEMSFELPGGVLLSDLDLTGRIQMGAPSGRTMHGTAPDFETANTIASRVLDCGGRLVSFAPHRKSLEDVFLREIAKAASSGAPAGAPHASPGREGAPAPDAKPRRRELEGASR
jgi:ABC-2 type transport system ATP-binding protein